MDEAPKLHDYMLSVLKVFADSEEHLYKEIPAYLENRYSLLEADRPNRARIMINNSIGQFVKALILEKTGQQKFKITPRGLALLEKKRPVSETMSQITDSLRYKATTHGLLTPFFQCFGLQ